jgi:protoporphyrinogen oxidase
MSDKTALIIGAGPAGLTCAYELLTRTDIRPIILEETSYIGGISRTAEYKGNRMDLGGHRFFSKNDDVMALWKKIMPVQGAPALDDKLLGREKPLEPGGPDPERDDAVMLVRNRVSRIFYLRKFFDYPISLKAQTFVNMGFSRTVKAGFGYLYAAVFKRKEDSLADFYINRFGKPLYEMFFEDYTEKVWGIHPSQIAPDWGAQRVKGLSLSKAMMAVLLKPFRRDQKKQETSLIEQYVYPKKRHSEAITLYRRCRLRILSSAWATMSPPTCVKSPPSSPTGILSPSACC